MLISCSQPGTQPANLQGLWNDKKSPPWDSKYTININTEMNYWSAESCNLAKTTEPLFSMLKNLSVTGAITSKEMYGCGGWVTHHSTDLWSISGPVDGAKWGMFPNGGAWLDEPKKEGEDPSPSPDPATKPSKPALKPSDLNKNAATQNIAPIKKEEKKKEEEIDPLIFFNTEHHEIKPIRGDKELNELLGIIEEVDKKETKKKEESESGFGSSSEDDGGITEEQRLMNKKLAQQKLFNNKDNRVTPTNNLFKPTKNKISEDMTKEVIMEKFGDDFDGAVELPELNEQKKQIMLKK